MYEKKLRISKERISVWVYFLNKHTFFFTKHKKYHNANIIVLIKW